MSFPRYPVYKNSGVEWLGEVPEHWAVLRLRFVATLNPSKQEAKSYSDDELVSFLPMEAIGEDGSLSFVQEKEVGECLNGYTYFTDGDVCIAKITPCFENGKGAIFRGLKGGIGFGTTELIVARPKTELLTAEFLDYLFRSNPFRTLGEAAMYGAGGQKRVPDAFVRDFSAFLPPLTEQQLIASFLDRETAKIDTLIAEQQRLIELLQEKRQAVISHAVTKGLNPNAPMKDSGVEWLGEVPEHWEVAAIKWTARINSGKALDPSQVISAEPNDADAVRLIGGNGLIGYTGQSLTKSPSIIIGRVGALCGNVHHELAACWVTDNALILRANPETWHLGYLSLCLKARDLNQLASKTAQPLIVGSDVSSQLVPIPPLEEQVLIESYIQGRLLEFESLLASLSQVNACLKERRSALISAAVTGQIDVRGIVPEASAQ